MSETPRSSPSDGKSGQHIVDWDDYDDEEKAEQLALLAQQHARRAAAAGKAAVSKSAEIEGPSPQELREAREAWAEAQYEKVADGWGKHGIEIPAQEELQAQFEMANELKNYLEAADARLQNKMEILLVPPSDVVGWPVPEELRHTTASYTGPRHKRVTTPKLGFTPGHQGINKVIPKRNVKTGVADHVDSHIPAPTPNSHWRVLIADTSERGVYMGSPEAILGSDRYMIGEQNTLGMGVAEYAALTLQTNRVIDDPNQTWLLKGCEDGVGRRGPIIAGFRPEVDHNKVRKPHHSQHYSFKFGNSESRQDTVMIRAAVEIPQRALPPAPEMNALPPANPKPLALPPAPIPMPPAPEAGGAAPMPPPPDAYPMPPASPSGGSGSLPPSFS